jgi:mRNA interferase RelE/StbE
MKKLGASYKIEYLDLVVKYDIPKLDKTIGGRIKKAIEIKLTSRPEIFGTPLRATLGGYWKLRVGDWRIVYLISAKTVKIIIIANRREVYDLADRRKSVAD